MSSNLPPGVTEGMIPGNRPEDMEWEKFQEQVDMDIHRYRLTPEEAYLIWREAIQRYAQPSG